MTTSLPTNSSEASLASAATNSASANGLLDAFAGAFTPLATAAESPLAGAAGMPDFARLLGTAPAGLGAASPSIGSGNGSVASLSVSAPLNANANPRGISVRSVVLHGDGTPSAASVGEAPGESPLSAGTDSPANALPERSTIEAALALVAPLTVSLAPPPPEQDQLPALLRREGDAESAPLVQADETVETPVYRVALTAPGRAPVEVALPVTADALPLDEIAKALRSDLGVPSEFAARNLPPFAPQARSAAGNVPVASDEPLASDSLIETSLELPGGARLTVAAPLAWRLAANGEQKLAATSAELPGSPRAGEAVENSAASASPILGRDSAPRMFSEKNFLTAAKSAVTAAREEGGIAVAQPAPAMPSSSSFAPIATAPAAAPVAALVEKLPAADAPVLTQAQASVAQRAVEAVTEVVETQAASRLQPVPSVQLRFKVGGEDLTVRVELRDGEVRTEFKTDNPELRTALAQEWRAVTGRADSPLRFLDPVIMSANTAGQGSGSFSSPQQHSFSQHQQQAQQQFRAQAEFFGSVGRSFAPAAESAESAAVAPVVLSTSHRLSAVA